MTVSKSGQDFTFERNSSGLKANGTTLGKGYSTDGALSAIGASLNMHNGENKEMDRTNTTKGQDHLSDNVRQMHILQ